tara:strand:- start:3526 stop:3666 length:141 start_codon:yes stop_codon:yes gene_type:complete
MEDLKVKELNYKFIRKSTSQAHWLCDTVRNIHYATTDFSNIEITEK